MDRHKTSEKERVDVKDCGAMSRTLDNSASLRDKSDILCSQSPPQTYHIDF